jgi:hypothetical protein
MLNRRNLRVLLVCALIAAASLAAGCRGGSGRKGDRAGKGGAAPSPPPAAGEAGPGLARGEISLLFPGTDDGFLHVEKRSVIAIEAPEDRAVQCLEELFRGPSPGLLAAVPDGVRVRQVYVLKDGTAWVDLSPEIRKLASGSAAELQTIYAIIDTIALNLPDVGRVGLLIEGETPETLAGHVSLERPFEPDYSWVEPSSRPEGVKTGAGPPGAEGEGDGSAAPGGTKPEGEPQGDPSSGTAPNPPAPPTVHV